MEEEGGEGSPAGRGRLFKNQNSFQDEAKPGLQLIGWGSPAAGGEGVDAPRRPNCTSPAPSKDEHVLIIGQASEPSCRASK